MVEKTIEKEPVHETLVTSRPKSLYQSNALKVAITAVMTALVTISTMFIAIPIPYTGGFFNIGEIFIYIAAILFGPYAGAIAGGVGAALADVALSYGMFAPGTLIGKGLEGFVVGFLYHKFKRENNVKFTILLQILVIILGGLIMVTNYLIYEMLILRMGPSAYQEIPWNLVQAFVGLVVAVPINLTVQKLFKDQELIK